ncbi:telomeric repeat-binding factor 2-interacting protein 1 [Hemiscyllium ocellatum]|uniref:telomeric repeat-binding factor 2-interacting protein 1 n=1 Tax=Hemiscyllium ocellatum TaxID=170820 RepID=UPI00296613AF|nr:telomeric repeat-binding factor 2-interacting protein 1 [Hemiscyllium ocellatum]
MAGGGEWAAAALTHSRTLFLDDRGVPLRFYLPPGPTKASLSPLIIHGGGVMCRLREPDAILLTELAAEGPTPRGYISARYVLDCVEQDKQLTLEEYGTSPKVVTSLGRGRLTYTEEEDAAILSYVRCHGDGSVTGNTLWMEMERNNVTAHSWQSMKSRYLGCLRGREQPDSAKRKRPAITIRTAPGAVGAQGEGKRNPENHQIELKSIEQATTSAEQRPNANSDEECCNIFHVAIREFEVDDDTPEMLVEIGGEMEKVPQKQEIESDGLPQVSPVEHHPKRKGTLAEFIMDNKHPEIDSQTPVDEVSSLSTASQDEIECAIQAVNMLIQTHHLDVRGATQLLLKNNGELTAAMHYMETGHRPDGYPIWTRQDDIDLENVDAQVQERLIQKFGSENLAKRIAFRNI